MLASYCEGDIMCACHACTAWQLCQAFPNSFSFNYAAGTTPGVYMLTTYDATAGPAGLGWHYSHSVTLIAVTARLAGSAPPDELLYVGHTCHVCPARQLADV